ncbi:MAG: FtsX-like permease family protein [Eubacterium sp.]|nr:FtsX-like permease family protein [Eubacterium sp.]
MLKLAWKYMRYYKKQTSAIFTAILLTAALLSGISSLIYSSQKSDLANSKMIYGDWHYYVQADQEVCQTMQNKKQEDGYSLDQCARMDVRDVVSKPYKIYFIYADEAYRQMMHRDLLEGSYPKKADEIAADRYVLGNLGFSGGIGDSVSVGGRDYIVTGILKSRWAAGTGDMEVFVSDSSAGRGSRTFLYIRFHEQKKLYKQLEAFQKAYAVSSDRIEANDEVIKYLGGEKPDSIWDIVTFAVTQEDGNFTYIVLKLQGEYNLAYYGMIFLLCLFSLFVVYSVFSISVSKRTSEYGMLQTLGICESQIGRTLILELWMLFIIGYPLGCLLGNGILRLAYQKLNGVFGGKGVSTVTQQLSVADQTLAEGTKAAEYFCAWEAVWAGFVFLLFSLAAVGLAVIRSMRRKSLKEAMSGDMSYAKKRKIYALRDVNMARIVVRKFMFSNKKKVIAILLSLSVGGCIFLCTTYMIENLKVHAELSLQSDDGLGFDYKILLKSTSLQDTIPKAAAEQIKSMPKLEAAYATKYMMGELQLDRDEFLADENWSEYFDYQNADPYFVQQYGGICVEREDGTYGIKYDVYGYDEGLISRLEDFVLEGEIDLDQIKAGNQVIAAANMDGQGNYYFYGKKPGDIITLRVPKQDHYSDRLLKFQSRKDRYIEKQFEIAAIVSRPLAKEEGFLNTGSWKNAQSIFMLNQQMEQNFGVTDYSFINATPKAAEDTDQVNSQLLQAIQDLPKAVLQDYTAAIKTQKNYLRQQQIFFYGIAVSLLMISLLHIANSMNYTILARRREYGILRAMGITEAGFYRMILYTGILYGLLADVWMFLIYHLLLRQVMDYYMTHVTQFLHLQAGVPGAVLAGIMVLNVVISAAAVMFPAWKMAKEDVVCEIAG